MAIKEFREFFLRNIKVSSGAKQDQESGYVISYVVKGLTKFNRFLKGNYPSEGVFEKLFESIAFKLNPEDTASSSEQGLIKKATDTEAIDRLANPNIDLSIATVPHQLPEVVLDLTVNDTITSSGIKNGIKIVEATRTLGSGAGQIKRKIYQIESFGVPSARYLGQDFSSNNNTPSLVVGIAQNFFRHALTNGAMYKFEALLFVEPAGGAGSRVSIGGSVTATEIIYQVNYIDNTTQNLDYKNRVLAMNTNSNITNSNIGVLKIQGTIKCNAAGNLDLLYSQNTATGSNKVLKGSYFSIQEMTI